MFGKKSYKEKHHEIVKELESDLEFYHKQVEAAKEHPNIFTDTTLRYYESIVEYLRCTLKDYRKRELLD